MLAHIGSQGVVRQSSGGEDEIRTHGTCYSTPAFQASAFNHSATSPHRSILIVEKAERLKHNIARLRARALSHRSAALNNLTFTPRG